jgi:hypothetical protein
MEAPIACTLSADERAGRAAEVAALARVLRSREPTATGERMTFEDGDWVEDGLREFIAAEARCCPFLQMDLHHHDYGLVLDVAGPEQARSIIAEMFA